MLSIKEAGTTILDDFAQHRLKEIRVFEYRLNIISLMTRSKYFKHLFFKLPYFFKPRTLAVIFSRPPNEF